MVTNAAILRGPDHSVPCTSHATGDSEEAFCVRVTACNVNKSRLENRLSARLHAGRHPTLWHLCAHSSGSMRGNNCQGYLPYCRYR